MRPDPPAVAGGESSLPADLARLVQVQIDARMEVFTKNLIQTALARSRKAIDAGAINERIELLERSAASQLRALANIQQSTRATAQQIDHAVTAIDRALVPRASVPAAYMCWKCSSTDIRPSQPDGFWDGFLSLCFVRPFRCRKCLHRFYRF